MTQLYGKHFCTHSMVENAKLLNALLSDVDHRWINLAEYSLQTKKWGIGPSKTSAEFEHPRQIVLV